VIPAVAILLCGGLVADGIRPRVSALYAALQGPSLRLSPDTAGIPANLEGPPGAAAWELSRDGGPRPCGTEVLAVSWRRADGTPMRKDWIHVRVVRTELLPVARERLLRGRALDSTAVRWEWLPTGGRSAPPPDSATASRWTVRTGAQAGRPIPSELLVPPNRVHAGDRVLVRSSRSGASASVEGIAQSDVADGADFLALTPWGRRIRCHLQPDGSAISLQ
jgi:hypothetical protein